MEGSTSLAKIGALGAFFALFCLRFYVPDDDEANRLKMSNVLASLLAQENSVQIRPQAKVAIGYGACQDIFVNAHDILGSLSPPGKLANFNEIQDMPQLLNMFGYFFSHGAASERFCPNDDLFKDLVRQSLLVPGHRTALGGNAPVMGRRFALEGAQVLLAAKMTPELQKSLHESVQVTGPQVSQDDIHLILEYQRNQVWSGLQAPRANRFIIHSDRNNPTLSSIESFQEPLANFRPDLLVISGLQMMDNYPFAPGQRQARLLKVQEQMASNPRTHFELASFVDESLFKDLTQSIIPYADSLGMNEQELPNLRSMLLYGNISVVSDSNPRTAVTLDQMRDVYRVLSSESNSQSSKKRRPLTRLHLHTLAYQAILVAQGSAWKNTRVAAAKASLTANRHVCASQEIDLDKAFLLMDDSFALSVQNGAARKEFHDKRPVACWKEIIDDMPPGGNPHVEICLAPNLVCAEAKQTAGCGDNISAAGLVLQI